MLMNFGEVSTDKGNLEFTGDILEVGTEVFIDDMAAPDGDYETEDRIIVVVDGVVTDIKEKEAPAEEEAPAIEEEAPAEEEISFEDNIAEILQPLVDQLNQAKADVEALRAEIEPLKARLAEIEAKLLEDSAKPAEEEFKEAKTKSNFFRN